MRTPREGEHADEAVEARAVQLAAGHRRPGEVGAAELAVQELAAGQLGLVEVGAGEVAVVPAGRLERGHPEARRPSMRHPSKRTWRNLASASTAPDSRQSVERAPLEAGFLEVDAGQVAALDDDVAEAQLRQAAPRQADIGQARPDDADRRRRRHPAARP